MLKAEKGAFDTSICLGDLVNYGPWSNECVDLARSLPHLALLMGNHEEAFLQGAYPGNNELVQQFFKKTWPGFDRKEEIAAFLPAYQLAGYTFQHTIQDSYIYPDTKVKLDASYIIGHSHHQFHYLEGGHQLYNAGSVGQNRAWINVISYLLMDTETGAVEMRNCVYDVDPVIDRMRALDYPESCIAYYANKKRA